MTDPSDKLPCIRTERAGGVATVWLDRPQKRNALSPAMVAELAGAIDEIRQADDRAVVLASTSPGIFCAGADLGELHSMSAGEAERFSAFSRRTFQSLETLDAPVIGAIDGFALAGGFELALACTLRVASSASVFGLPEITLGIIPGAGGTDRLTALAGRAVAADLVLTGRRLTADQAIELGLLSRLAGPGEALATALAIAEEVSSRSREAVARGLAALRNPGSEPGLFGLSVETAAAREAIERFASPRPAEEGPG